MCSKWAVISNNLAPNLPHPARAAAPGPERFLHQSPGPAVYPRLSTCRGRGNPGKKPGLASGKNYQSVLQYLAAGQGYGTAAVWARSDASGRPYFPGI